MNTKLDVQEFTTRIKIHSKENYVFIYSVMKALAMYSACVALHTIISGLIAGRAELSFRLPFWLASFAAVILTYNATMVGLLVIAYVPNWEDAVVPFTLATIEYLLFSVLADANPQSTLWQYWLLVFAAFALVCNLKIRNTVKKLKLENYHDNLRDIVSDYIHSIKKEDIPSSMYCAIFSLAAWLLIFVPGEFTILKDWLFRVSPNWHALLGVPALAVMIFAIRTSEKARRCIVTSVNEKLGVNSADELIFNVTVRK